MAYDRELAERLRVAIGHVPGLSEKAMFGGLAFLVGGSMAVAAGHQGDLLLRCDPADTEEHVRAPGVERYEMRGRAMDGWLHVAPQAVETDVDLDRWVAIGLDYAASLPKSDRD
ncbi:MAG: TfoX/Sxy family protein [Actinomycetota bacterium]|nr:TfoX/Sxy family protein [Actinomycetota bacterium]